MTDLPAEVVAALERLSLVPHLELRLLPVDAFLLVTTLQRALRHPQFPPGMRHQVVQLAEQLEHLVAAQEPMLGQYLAAGWDPTKDPPA
jgi:hypothetical protein